MTDIQQLVQKYADEYGTERRYLLPILQGIVKDERSLSIEAMIEVAKLLDVSAAEIYGTASFYHFLETEPMGKCKIHVCKSIICENKRKKDVLAVLEDILKIKVGSTTKDERFSLDHTNCLGMCHKGPVMLINDKVYSELTPDKTREIIMGILREEREKVTAN